MQLNPSNDTMEAIRLFRAELPSFLSLAVEQEKERIVKAIEENNNKYFKTRAYDTHGYSHASRDIITLINNK